MESGVKKESGKKGEEGKERRSEKWGKKRKTRRNESLRGSQVKEEQKGGCTRAKNRIGQKRSPAVKGKKKKRMKELIK